MNAKERQIFEWLIEQVVSIDHALYLRGQEQRALVEVLASKGIVTRQEWDDMVKKRRARRKEPLDGHRDPAGREQGLRS
jgi:hypothetical protein